MIYVKMYFDKIQKELNRRKKFEEKRNLSIPVTKNVNFTV